MAAAVNAAVGLEEDPAQAQGRVPFSTKRKKGLVLFVRTDACTMDPRIQKEAETLELAGYVVRVFGWDRRREWPAHETINGVEYRRSRIPAPYASRLLALVLPLFWVRVAWRIACERPDVVHACDLDALIPSLVARPFIRKAIVYDIFDTFADKISGVPHAVRTLLRRLDESLMRRADVVIVADEQRKLRLRDVPGVLPEVIMNVPRDMGLPAPFSSFGEFVVCYAGSIHEHRGLGMIIEAVRDLTGVKAIFAGWIPRAVDREKLLSEKHVRYVGKLEYAESLALLGRSHVVLALYDPSLPINAQASSNKVYEAMAVGRPVITNVETTMAPLVREEACGELIPYGDVEALRAQIIRLQQSPDLCKKLGGNGRQAFVNKYNWPVMESRLLSVYQAMNQER
jgi:glycosyltransferase involved in cell wall biosynthesis